MPTEHEYKYILNKEMYHYFQEQIHKLDYEKQDIRQGYLAFSKGMSARVRCIGKSDKEKWYFTFKQKVANRVVEIETKIKARDGEDLWKVAMGKLKKDRFVFDNKGETWEVDFFWKEGSVYFILMEVELEEGAERPKEVPDFITPYVVHEVELGDDRFSNKRLGDVEFATNIYQEITKDKNNEHEQNIQFN